MEPFEMFTKDQFKELATAQENLNIKYSGENWGETLPTSHLFAAAFAELGELLESAPRTGVEGTNGWRWWREDLENDDNNIKVEAVDILHFILSVLIKKYDRDIDEVVGHYGACSSSFVENSNDISEDFGKFDKVNKLLVPISSMCLTASVDEAPKEDIMEMFVFIVAGLSEFAEMSADEMFELYMKKNNLNHERVEGGYGKEGSDYKKIDENGQEDNVKLFDD